MLNKDFKSYDVTCINISNIRNAHITQVVTKFVVSTTLDKRFLFLSVEHWKSLNGFNDHINIDNDAPAKPNDATRLKPSGIFKIRSRSCWKATNNPITNPGRKIKVQKILNLDTKVFFNFSNKWTPPKSGKEAGLSHR